MFVTSFEMHILIVTQSFYVVTRLFSRLFEIMPVYNKLRSGITVHRYTVTNDGKIMLLEYTRTDLYTVCISRNVLYISGSRPFMTSVTLKCII